MKYFVAFGSEDNFHAQTIASAATTANNSDYKYVVWSLEDRSGVPLNKAVDGWLDEADGLVADITYVNDNVTYEIGYAIGAGKDIRLIRNSSVDISELRKYGLLDNLIRNEFKTKEELERILKNPIDKKNKWSKVPLNVAQPLYILAPSTAGTLSGSLFSDIKKKTKFKFRSFKAWEIARLNAQEAWEQVASSHGVVVTWQDSSSIESKLNNQRAAFIFGLARGLDIPALLLAYSSAKLPADLEVQASRWSRVTDLNNILIDFRDEVQDSINDRQNEDELPYMFLDSINCGDPAAENEQDQLKKYFLETDEFKQTFRGEANLILGRKGSGKSAIFLQVRDRIRVNKRNLVVDLNPEGYQLIKFKEVVAELNQHGIRKEFIAAFWQYILWLEIAYKILEKDEYPAQRDDVLGKRYDQLKKLFLSRVDTGMGDFSERLKRLTEMISERFENRKQKKIEVLTSSQVLEVIYGSDISQIRDAILSYLNLKGTVLFLFDNLDRMRSPSGFDGSDALILLGLVECMQDISKHFKRHQFDFRWVVFIRSDVYEFIVQDMTDYGKHSALTLDWRDKEILKRLLQRRIEFSADGSGADWSEKWAKISTPTVKNQDALDFIVSASLMRPRYVIRLFEMAKRRAVNMGHQRIDESDYEAALEELGWTVMEDLDLELRDIMKNSQSLLFDISQLDGACGLSDLKEAVAKRVGATKVVDRVIDVMLWSGGIGISPNSSTTTYIFDCGYKLQFLHSLMERNPDAEVRLHPTLRNIMSKASNLAILEAKALSQNAA